MMLGYDLTDLPILLIIILKVIHVATSAGIIRIVFFRSPGFGTCQQLPGVFYHKFVS